MATAYFGPEGDLSRREQDLGGLMAQRFGMGSTQSWCFTPRHDKLWLPEDALEPPTVVMNY